MSSTHSKRLADRAHQQFIDGTHGRWIVKDGVVRPIGKSARRYRAVLSHEDLPGWELTVDTAWTAVGGNNISRLELRAVEPGTRLTGEQMRLVTPQALLATLDNPWLLEDDSAVVPERSRSGTRVKRTDDYLYRLAKAAITEKHTGGIRKALAIKFGRSESQIRDDLLRATKRDFLESSGPGKRSRVAGPRLLSWSKRHIEKGQQP